MILVTGGAGYIGSHTCIELLNAGFELVVLDNLANASLENLKLVEQITSCPIHFVNGDICNKSDLAPLFQQYDINAVIHFAGLKSPIESLQSPAEYFNVNVAGTLNLLQTMTEYHCKKLIFSSSASVYANSSRAVSEQSPLNPSTPYSRSKRMVEQMLSDLFQADPEWSISILRYFNPVGAHHSGLIGENPKVAATNLMPCLLEVAIGKRESLKIFGNDYPTPDGTGVRDYIHVMDLASAHVATLKSLSKKVQILNIGRGIGHSVLELIQAFESVTEQKITYEIVAKRPNDLAFSLADPSLANQVLAWQAQYNLSDMCADSWRWQQNASALF